MEDKIVEDTSKQIADIIQSSVDKARAEVESAFMSELRT